MEKVRERVRIMKRRAFRFFLRREHSSPCARRRSCMSSVSPCISLAAVGAAIPHGTRWIVPAFTCSSAGTPAGDETGVIDQKADTPRIPNATRAAACILCVPHPCMSLPGRTVTSADAAISFLKRTWQREGCRRGVHERIFSVFERELGMARTRPVVLLLAAAVACIQHPFLPERSKSVFHSGTPAVLFDKVPLT